MGTSAATFRGLMAATVFLKNDTPALRAEEAVESGYSRSNNDAHSGLVPKLYLGTHLATTAWLSGFEESVMNGAIAKAPAVISSVAKDSPAVSD
jgi:hypothetical protein